MKATRLAHLSLRLRVFLIFAGLAAGICAVVGLALWAAAARLASRGVAFLGEAAPGAIDAFALAAIIAGFGTLGLIVWVWWLFDRHVAAPIGQLAGGLRAGALALDGGGAYLADLLPAAQDLCRGDRDAPQREAVLKEVLADPGAGLVLVDAVGCVVLVNAAAGVAEVGFEAPAWPDGWPRETRRRDITDGWLAILPAEPPRVPALHMDLGPLLLQRVPGLSALRYVVFDTETTGLDPSKDRLVQIAGVEIMNGRRTGRVFSELINPERPIPARATLIHGLTDHDVASAAPEGQVLAAFAEFAEGAVLVAHHMRFDMGFLRAAQARGGPAFDHPQLDTVLLSALLWGRDAAHSLDALAARLRINLPPEQRHTALGDAQATAQAFLAMLSPITARGVTELSALQAEAAKHAAIVASLGP